jgi:hypothetical protein
VGERWAFIVLDIFLFKLYLVFFFVFKEMKETILEEEDKGHQTLHPKKMMEERNVMCVMPQVHNNQESE